MVASLQKRDEGGPIMSARLCLMLAALAAASAAAAQQRTDCDANKWGWRGPNAHVCEVRTLTVPAGGALSVDAGPNGSIGVTGENRRDVQVRATVHAWAYDEAEAERIAVAGNVRGRTTNGGVDAELTGRTWEGAGLDLTTTNGGVRLRIPENYSARLETGTVNGGIDIDFPVTVTGRLGREFSTTLGGGGPLVKAETTNGQVRISRDRGDLTRLP